MSETGNDGRMEWTEEQRRAVTVSPEAARNFLRAKVYMGREWEERRARAETRRTRRSAWMKCRECWRCAGLHQRNARHYARLRESTQARAANLYAAGMPVFDLAAMGFASTLERLTRKTNRRLRASDRYVRMLWGLKPFEGKR